MFQRVFSSRTVPLVLAGLVLLSYGLYIGWFGFYGDDWIYIYNYHVLGAGGFGDFVAADRPFSAWIYALTTPVFGESALPYHVLLLVLRWLSAVLVWWVLRLLWPGANRQAGWVALLFAVYPGFLQQPIAVQFILHFSVLDLFLFSLAAMLLAVHHPRWRWLWMALGLVSSLAIFSLEYFAGLELIRPVLLWLILGRQLLPARQRMRQTLTIWLPYLLVFVAFGFWRVFIFKFPTYQPALVEGLSEAPQAVIIQLLKRLALDIRTVTYGAWRQVVSLPEGWQNLLFYGLLVGLTFALLLFYLYRSRPEEAPFIAGSSSNLWGQWAVQALLLSLFMLLVAGLPFWVTFIRVELAFPWDRSTLPFMLGVCLLVVSLLELVIQPRFQRLILAGLVALSVGFHYKNALVYREEWQNLETYFTQLIWRAPALKQGTILVSDDIPLWRYSDNDLTPLVNWIYAPEYRSPQNLYKYFDLSTRVEDVLPGYEEGLPVRHSYRNHRFESTTSQVLSVYYKLSQCLWVLSPSDKEFPGLPASIAKTLSISHLDQIEDTDEPAKLPAVFGKEPSRDWCYYFEKADLARQKGDWQTAVALGEEAERQNLRANVSLEYLPFVESYAHIRDWQKARQYSGLVSEDAQNQPMLCAMWHRVSESMKLNTEEQKRLNEILEESGCR